MFENVFNNGRTRKRQSSSSDNSPHFLRRNIVNDIGAHNMERDVVIKLGNGVESISRKMSLRDKATPSSISHNSSLKPHKRTVRGKFTIFVVAIIALVIIFWIVGTVFFHRASIIVEPITYTGSVDKVMTAVSQPSSETDVPFRTMAMSHTESTILKADGEEEVVSYAKGRIVIFNETSSQQRFREETRFKSSQGLIFKLPKGDGVSVPAGSSSRPGSIEVEVIAEKPGPDYNIGLSDFTIPGWDEINDARFKTQYARSKTSMSGGVLGTRPVVASGAKDSAVQELLEKSKKVLTEKIILEKPKDMFLPSSGMYYHNQEPAITTLDEQAKVELTVSVTAVIFQHDAFADALARLLSGDKVESDSQHFVLHNPDDIMVEFSPETNMSLRTFTDSALSPTSLRFRVTGYPLISKVVDVGALKKNLAGKRINEISEVLDSLIGIRRVVTHIKPIWQSHIPMILDDISVEIKYPKRTSQVAR
ncbi:hypothetical protein A2997_00425 [Candidatus Nomurabacteria bacterium RIFCSPLOWO2_01_FULL_36_10b]|uniref:Baseplate protein J-like domain-containing protein n=1 Tax=Candidatus Nomurabacteria bacterium RIFCSPLOWO2_01_FULL_36_10b TaxID=1801766 RepID=A0A1F6WNS3_9BACT|nr:MAG: hypothetical protein A2997_00425 [Candidatus Nomurabacteria bacterium RIFCSPLOWO2_01_FULL_36_10b]